MAAADFVRAAEDGPLRLLVLAWTQALQVQIAQSSACARLHGLEHRLARWVLVVQDRRGGELLPLTQEFVGQMLGVRRASVSVVAGQLERAGYIRQRRGAIEILDREALELLAGDCYRVIRDAHERAVHALA
jgi:CRP-like cAMP-binding protein